MKLLTLIKMLFELVLIKICGSRGTITYRKVKNNSSAQFVILNGKYLVAINDFNGLNKILSQKFNGRKLRDFGWGNGFVMKNENKLLFFTAKHCISDKKLLQKVYSTDIAVFNGPKSFLIPNLIFKADLQLQNNYSGGLTLIKGYLQKRGSDKLEEVTIKGYAVLRPKEFVNLHDYELKNENFFFFRMKSKEDVRGLSGSPAFNEQGEVVGIFTGAINTNNKKVWYAVILPFGKLKMS